MKLTTSKKLHAENSTQTTRLILTIEQAIEEKEMFDDFLNNEGDYAQNFVSVSEDSDDDKAEETPSNVEPQSLADEK